MEITFTVSPLAVTVRPLLLSLLCPQFEDDILEELWAWSHTSRECQSQGWDFSLSKSKSPVLSTVEFKKKKKSDTSFACHWWAQELWPSKEMGLTLSGAWPLMYRCQGRSHWDVTACLAKRRRLKSIRLPMSTRANRKRVSPYPIPV